MGEDRDVKRSKKIPLGVFFGLCVIAILLIVGVAIILSNKPEGTCLDIENSEEMRDCIEKLYYEDEEAAEAMHAEAKTRAFEAKNYDLFTDITFDRALAWSSEDVCGAALIEIEDDRVKEMPAENRAYYYGQAVQVAVECEFDEKAEDYQKTYARLLNSGEIDEPSFLIEDEDYDVEEEEKEE